MEIGHRFLEKIFGSDVIRHKRDNCEPKWRRDHRKKSSAGIQGATVKSEHHQLLRPELETPERRWYLKIGGKQLSFSAQIRFNKRRKVVIFNQSQNHR